MPDVAEYAGLYACPRCSLISLQPYPDAETVAGWYATTGNWELLSPDEWRLPTLRRIEWIERLRGGQPGRVLEIGACRGDFLHQMALRGWEVDGIEPAAKDVEVARERYGLSLRHEFFTPEMKGEGNYDVVICWDVLEHCRFPEQIMSSMLSHLRPGGLLFLSVPHIEGAGARGLKRRWRYRMTPKHLHFFPLSWFEERAREHGSELVEANGFIKIHAWLEAATPSMIMPILKFSMQAKKTDRLQARVGERQDGTGDRSESPLSALRRVARSRVLRINQTPVPLPLADLLDVALRRKD
ncbi:MAG: class I SAM-dependent methyltransferase [Bradymonadaceae bacterium]